MTDKVQEKEFLSALHAKVRPGVDLIRLPDGCKIPVYRKTFDCMVFDEPMSQKKLEAYHAVWPSHPIHMRFFTHEKMPFKDTFRVAADPENLYFQFFFDHRHTLESKACKHVLFITDMRSDTPVHTLEIDYSSDQTIDVRLGEIERFVSFSKRPHQSIDSTIRIKKSDLGYGAFVCISLCSIGAPIRDIACNAVRLAWGANPPTAAVPIIHSYYTESHQRALRIGIFLDEKVRLASLRPIHANEPKAFAKRTLPSLRYHNGLLCFDSKWSNMSDDMLMWVAPNGQCTRLCLEKMNIESNSVDAFVIPDLTQDGLYGLSDGDETFAVEKRDLIEAENFLSSVKQKTVRKSLNIDKISKTAKRLLTMIPPLSGIENVPDPKDPMQRPWNLFDYDLTDPHHIRSKKTGDRYPSTAYREQNVTKVQIQEGKTAEYLYHIDQNGVKYYLTPALYAAQKKAICGHIEQLANEDPAGAAHVLAALSQAYEAFMPALDHYYINAPVPKRLGPPYPYFGGMWSRWFYHELGLIANIAKAYARIEQTDAFSKLAEKTGQKVREDVYFMIKDTVDFIQSYGVQNGNMDSAVWKGLILTGHALNRLDYIKDAVCRMTIFMQRNFMFDGFWRETTLSYHTNIVNGLVEAQKLAFAYLNGDGRPNGCTQQNDPLYEHPILQKACAITQACQFPNGRFFAIQDTHLSVIHKSRASAYENLLLPAAKIVRLADENAENQTQLLFMAVAKYGHSHRDALHFSLFFDGLEWLPDFGYTHTNNRSWTLSTLGHNTVVVDQSDSNNQKGGSLTAYLPFETSKQQKHALGYVKGNDARAYGSVDVYERSLVMAERSDSGSCGYVLDCFLVQGGTRHEYTLNLCADVNIRTVCSNPFQSMSETMLPEGVSFRKPIRESDRGDASGHYHAYMYVEQVQSVPIKDQAYILEADTQTSSLTSGLRIIGTEETGQLMLGRVPSMRNTRRSFDDDLNDRKDAHWTDKLVVRREAQTGAGSADMVSVFVHAFEPKRKGLPPYVQSVQKRFVNEHDQKDVVIIVTCEDCIDYYFMANDVMKTTVDGISFEGEFGYVRIQHGRLAQVHLLDARIEYEDQVHKVPASTVKIQKCLSKAFGDSMNGWIVKGHIPDRCVHSARVTFEDHTTLLYQVKDIQAFGSQWKIDLGQMDPGFAKNESDEYQLRYFPYHIFGETADMKLF